MYRHEDIRTAIYSFAHTLRDNVDKLERHERREKQAGDDMQKILMTIVDKQREKFVEDKALESVLFGLEQNINLLKNAETEKVRNIKMNNKQENYYYLFNYEKITNNLYDKVRFKT